MPLPTQALFDLKKNIETATPEQMALLQKKAEATKTAEKKSWWSSKTKTQKGLIIGGGVVVVGLLFFGISKAIKNARK